MRQQAAETKLAPAAKLADINARIEQLQQKIDNTQAEEEPIKAELRQAQNDFGQAQSADEGLDQKYYKQLESLPAENVLKRIPVQTNGRFTWIEDTAFVEGENEHRYWIFTKATRADGRQYWSLGRFSISKDSTTCVTIDPSSFVSTKAVLRPNLTPEEQAQ